MNLSSEIFGNVIVVHAPEELAAEAAEQFEAYLPTVERENVVLDVDKTEILDSAGLAALLNCQDAMARRGGRMKISAANATNRKILEVTRIDRQIEVFSSVIDAVKSFQ
ncbi:MAG: STAS domain-containing protein [Planctomycetia bacterium]|nr:STAS domain-containing protein [Planctomycetia bacterium]